MKSNYFVTPPDLNCLTGKQKKIMKTKEIKTTALIGAAVIATSLVGFKATSTVKEREILLTTIK